MNRLSYSQQMDIISSLLEEEINALKALPPKEAKIAARKGLQDIGILDSNGQLTEPYLALLNR